MRRVPPFLPSSAETSPALDLVARWLAAVAHWILCESVRFLDFYEKIQIKNSKCENFQWYFVQWNSYTCWAAVCLSVNFFFEFCFFPNCSATKFSSDNPFSVKISKANTYSCKRNLVGRPALHYKIAKTNQPRKYEFRKFLPFIFCDMTRKGKRNSIYQGGQQKKNWLVNSGYRVITRAEGV